MLSHAQILRLVPHQGAMCLLDEATHWSAEGILCRARSHLAPTNPLRRGGRLGAICGIEYGLQAAALHGALCEGGAPRRQGVLAALRDVELLVERLDERSIPVLSVEARLARQEDGGTVYDFRLEAEPGRTLVRGRAVMAFPARSRAILSAPRDPS